MHFTKYNVSETTSIKYDLGLRQYMLRIFNYMSIALAVTGLVAMLASHSPAFTQFIFNQSGSLSPLGWVLQLAPLFIVLFFSYKINSISAQTAQTVFWVYSVSMGLALSVIFIAYSDSSIARAFLVSASLFGAMSIYGYSTKKDLTSVGSFLIMGLIGILLASLVNLFLHSSALNFATSVMGVLIFTGLTAYDVQKLKNLYFQASNVDQDAATKLAISGALTLYLDFINLFLMLLRLFGSRRD